MMSKLEVAITIGSISVESATSRFGNHSKPSEAKSGYNTGKTEKIQTRMTRIGPKIYLKVFCV